MTLGDACERALMVVQKLGRQPSTPRVKASLIIGPPEGGRHVFWIHSVSRFPSRERASVSRFPSREHHTGDRPSSRQRFCLSVPRAVDSATVSRFPSREQHTGLNNPNTRRMSCPRPTTGKPTDYRQGKARGGVHNAIELRRKKNGPFFRAKFCSTLITTTIFFEKQVPLYKFMRHRHRGASAKNCE